jgi:hypothetical protein
VGSEQPFTAPWIDVGNAERLCENYRELLQMPKIARFGRALVELNHQISNSRKRAARNHKESRVFTQPPDKAAVCSCGGCNCGKSKATFAIAKTKTRQLGDNL